MFLGHLGHVASAILPDEKYYAPTENSMSVPVKELFMQLVYIGGYHELRVLDVGIHGSQQVVAESKLGHCATCIAPCMWLSR